MNIVGGSGGFYIYEEHFQDVAVIAACSQFSIQWRAILEDTGSEHMEGTP